MSRKIHAQSLTRQVERNGTLWLFASLHHPESGKVELISRRWSGWSWITTHRIFLPAK